jgi:two-component system chemotaxis response regulator CheB
VRTKRTIRLLAIACGEGGPAPAAYLLRHLPENAPPMVVMQKKPSGFAKDYTGKLSGMCGRRITACGEATRLSPGDIYFAAEESRPEIKMTANGILLWFAERRQGDGTDAFLGSVAASMGEEAACVLLSGGSFGVTGLSKVVKKGGLALQLNKNVLLREAGHPSPGGIAELPLEDIASILSASLLADSEN